MTNNFVPRLLQRKNGGYGIISVHPFISPSDGLPMAGWTYSLQPGVTFCLKTERRLIEMYLRSVSRTSILFSISRHSQHQAWLARSVLVFMKQVGHIEITRLYAVKCYGCCKEAIECMSCAKHIYANIIMKAHVLILVQKMFVWFCGYNVIILIVIKLWLYLVGLHLYS